MRARFDLGPQSGRCPRSDRHREGYFRPPCRNRGPCPRGAPTFSRHTFSFRWFYYVGLAKLLHGADADAVVWLRRSIETYRDFFLPHFLLASALALQGQLDQAKAAAETGLLYFADFTIRRYRTNAPSNNQAFLAERERIYDGMRIAGVPEG